MKFKFINIQTVLARIQDSFGPNHVLNYGQITQWINQVIAKIATRDILVLKSQPLSVCNHTVELPCDLIAIIAVEHEGCRLRYSNGKRTYEHVSMLANGKPSGSDVTYIPYIERHIRLNEEGKLIDSVYGLNRWTETLKRVKISKHIEDTYNINPPYLKTSFESGTVHLHYVAPYTDEDGNLMIPDNQELLTALEYYVLHKALMMGYNHPLFKGEQSFFRLKQEYEKHLRKAMGQLTFPSPDEVESIANSLNRYMKERTYFGSFSEGLEQPVNPFTQEDYLDNDYEDLYWN